MKRIRKSVLFFITVEAVHLSSRSNYKKYNDRHLMLRSSNDLELRQRMVPSVVQYLDHADAGTQGEGKGDDDEEHGQQSDQ